MSYEIDDNELEAIRKRRLAEMQSSTTEEDKAGKIKQAEAQKQAVLRTILTTEARQRINNIKMVKPEFAEQLELQLIQLAQTGRLKIPLEDEQLKEVLKHMQSQRKDIKIRRI